VRATQLTEQVVEKKPIMAHSTMIATSFAIGATKVMPFLSPLRQNENAHDPCAENTTAISRRWLFYYLRKH